MGFLQGINPHNGQRMGKANTALVMAPGGRLMALEEGDLPYEMTLPSLDTVGKVGGFGPLPLSGTSFTAHPKVDPVNGDMAFFGYELSEPPRSPKHQLCYVEPLSARISPLNATPPYHVVAGAHMGWWMEVLVSW